MAAVAPAMANVPDVDSIRNELDALQRERRVAEMRLRDLDAKRRMPVVARGGPRDARDGRPGSWISDRDRRSDFDRGGGNERDRPHHWDGDRGRDPDRPHPWDVQKGPESGRKALVLSSVTRAGDRRSDKSDNVAPDSARNLKRSGEDRGKVDEDEDRKPKKRKSEHEDVVREKEQVEPDRDENRGKYKPEVPEDEDDGADLPDRDRDDRDSYRSARRAQLSSVVAVGRPSEQSDRRERRRETRSERIEKPKVPLSENTEIKQRNRKMFGALLGHLQKAKKDEEKILSTPTMQKRVEIEEKVEVLARESGEVLRKKLTEEMRDERRKNLEQIRLVRSRQQNALHLLAVARVESQCKALSCHIRTSTVPEIFWRPLSVETAPQKVKDLLAKSKEAVEANAATVRARIEAERAADLEAEAAAQAQRAADRAAGGAGYHEEEEEEAGGHGDGAGGHASSAPDPPPAPPKEQVVEEVDEEEGTVDVEIAF